MFWLSDKPLSHTVSLHWFRQEFSLPVGHDEKTQRYAENSALTWEAMSLAAEKPADVKETVIEGALWRQIGKSHYLSYLEPADLLTGAKNDKKGPERDFGMEPARQATNEARSERDRTTLKVEPTRLTLIRHGGVSWNSVFANGLKHHSVMVLGGSSLPVETQTMGLTIDVRPDGGEISLEYRLLIGNWPQHVWLRVQFAPDQEMQEV